MCSGEKKSSNFCLLSLNTELDQIDSASASSSDSCSNAEIVRGKTLKGGTKAGKFHPLGEKTMKSCIASCCERPTCDIAYLLNGKCYSVQCLDSRLCQPSSDPVKGEVQLAYVHKSGNSEKKRGKNSLHSI